MNAYFLPGVGIYGGIKVGFQFVDLLDSLGVRAIVATPQGNAPNWFSSSAPVVSYEEALSILGPGDNIIFSLPHDYEWLVTTGFNLIFHCQGTDPLIDRIIEDPKVTVLTCWEQASQYVSEKTDKTPINVGIHISDCFFYQADRKADGAVAYMPRRGADLTSTVEQIIPHSMRRPIDGVDEFRVAQILKTSSLFIATSINEWFGLPALEAMAAGCVVISVPVMGGAEYLKHGENCVVAAPGELEHTIKNIVGDDQAISRMALRNAAMATARRHYHREVQRDRVERLLQGSLALLN